MKLICLALPWKSWRPTPHGVGGLKCRLSPADYYAKVVPPRAGGGD